MRLFLVGLLLASPSMGISQEAIQERSYVEAADADTDLGYYQQANLIRAALRKEKIKVDREVVVLMLKAIDKNLPKFFPNGPFTRNDFIALAWLESEFRQFERGTHGEYGLFQIMPDEYEEWHVSPKYFYGVNTNTKMAFRVMAEKYARWQDHKKAIQAYNGVIRLKNGKWSEKYWNAFQKRKVAVDIILQKQ